MSEITIDTFTYHNRLKLEVYIENSRFFSKHAENFGFKSQMENPIKLKLVMKPFPRVHGNMSFNKTTPMKTNMRG